MAQSEQGPLSMEEVRQRVSSSGYFQLLDLRIDDAQDGRGVVSIQVDERLMHSQQMVHGGVIFTLADTAMSMALLSVLPPGTRFSTIEAKINYLLPVRSGTLQAEGTLAHRGRSTAVLEASVYNLHGKERQTVARVLGTFHISLSSLNK